jgi:DNA polymerase III epsilon subunit-like protein
MTGTLIFLDTETTSLRPDRRVWEIGFYVRKPGEPQADFRWFVDLADLDLGGADLMSLKIGGFYDRHPQANPGAEGRVLREHNIMEAFERHSRGAHLVGNVVSFDADVIGQRMREHHICPSWHYHLIDCEALAIGYLAAQNHTTPTPFDARHLPWDSEAISLYLGVDPAKYDRHTALGDARWAMDVYDAVHADG